MIVPSMLKAGNPRKLSASIIAASASTAILIPPSIALFVYSILVPGIDLRSLFAAGLIPAVLAGVAIMVPAVLLRRRHNVGVHERADLPAFWPSLWAAVPGVLAPGVVLCGLRCRLLTQPAAARLAAAPGSTGRCRGGEMQ